MVTSSTVTESQASVIQNSLIGNSIKYHLWAYTGLKLVTSRQIVNMSNTKNLYNASQKRQHNPELRRIGDEVNTTD